MKVKFHSLLFMFHTGYSEVQQLTFPPLNSELDGHVDGIAEMANSLVTLTTLSGGNRG